MNAWISNFDKIYKKNQNQKKFKIILSWKFVKMNNLYNQINDFL